MQIKAIQMKKLLLQIIPFLSAIISPKIINSIRKAVNWVQIFKTAIQNHQMDSSVLDNLPEPPESIKDLVLQVIQAFSVLTEPKVSVDGTADTETTPETAAIDTVGVMNSLYLRLATSIVQQDFPDMDESTITILVLFVYRYKL